MTTLISRLTFEFTSVEARKRFRIHPAWLLGMALLPVLWWVGKRLDDGNDERLGLLTLAVAIGLAWRDRQSLVSSSSSRISGAVLVFASVIGVHGLPPMLRAGLAICGVACWFGMHRRIALLGLLLLSLPVAASMQFYLGYPLRVVAAEGAVRLLELGAVVVARHGTQVELAGQVIGVDPACGGVRMLWHALAAAMALAALHRLTPRATVVAGLLAFLLVIPANVVRASLLVLRETGAMPEIVLGHGGVGLVSFGIVLVPLWLAISSRARASAAVVEKPVEGWLEMRVLGLAALLAPLVMMIETTLQPELPQVAKNPGVFTFDGLTLPLTQLAATEMEMAFARSFPGTLASYDWGGRQVILRRVDRATRRLHPTRDCLRAAGFETTDGATVTMSDGSVWARFHAGRDGRWWTVCERIVSTGNGATWTDASAWFWAAARHPLNGPWQAETVIGE